MDNKESLISGMTMTAAVTLIIDGCARIISGFIWTINIGLGAVLAVWLPQFLFHPFVGLVVIIICIRHCHKNGNHFTHGYLIFPLHCFLISFLQMLIPSITLTLAYPTQMISIMMSIPTYLFTVTTIVTLTIEGFQLKMFRLNNNEDENMIQAWLCYIGSFAVIIFATLVTISIVLIFIYLELIGRGFAINAGPPFIVSVVIAAIITQQLYLKAIKRLIFS